MQCREQDRQRPTVASRTAAAAQRRVWRSPVDLPIQRPDSLPEFALAGRWRPAWWAPLLRTRQSLFAAAASRQKAGEEWPRRGPSRRLAHRARHFAPALESLRVDLAPVRGEV